MGTIGEYPHRATLSLEVAIDYSRFVTRLFKPMTSDAEYMMHAAVGIAGEAGEIIDVIKKSWVYEKALDLDNLAEELGDILFYMQAMAGFYRATLVEVKPLRGELETVTLRQIGNKIFINAAEVLAMAVPPLPNRARMLRALGYVLHYVIEGAHYCDKTLNEIIFQNQDKLTKRYPQLFYRDADAIARADKIGEAGASS